MAQETSRLVEQPPLEVGGLILRGNRCVLARSLSGQWQGMRIPSVVSRANETPIATALRSVVEACDVDQDEVRVLRRVSPVTTYAVRDGKLRPIAVYPLYATCPPPAGSADTVDEEEEKDPYDWYTLPRALAALASDQFACAALAALACSLAAGAAAGAVPDKWGGVFGRDWAGSAFQRLPLASEGGLSLVPAKRSLEPPRIRSGKRRHVRGSASQMHQCRSSSSGLPGPSGDLVARSSDACTSVNHPCCPTGGGLTERADCSDKAGTDSGVAVSSKSACAESSLPA